MEHRQQIHLSRIIRQILLNDSAQVNLMQVLQQILLDEKLKFVRVWWYKPMIFQTVIVTHLCTVQHLWPFLKSDRVNLVTPAIPLFTQCPGDTVLTGTGKIDPARKFKCILLLYFEYEASEIKKTSVRIKWIWAAS